jgi:hypothetical protein
MMHSNEFVQRVNQYSDEILEVIYNHEQFTTSDLQGVVAAIVTKIYNEGKNAKVSAALV